MNKTPAMRSASEPVTELFELPETTSSSKKRPVELALGTLLVILRAIGGISVGITLAQEWPRVREELNLDAAEADLLFRLLIAAQVGWAVAALIVIWLTWRGSNRARLLVMMLTSISLTIAAVSHFVSGGKITLHTTLLTISLDILILLTLSDRDVAAWTRARTRGRSRRKTQPSKRDRQLADPASPAETATAPAVSTEPNDCKPRSPDPEDR